MQNALRNNGMLLSLLSTVLFSVQFPLIRLGLNYIHSAQAAVLEAGLTIGFCLVLMRLQGQLASFRFSWNGALPGLLNAAGLILLFESLARVHPGIVGLIGRLYFVYAMLLAWLYFRERSSKAEVPLMVLAISGVFLVSHRHELSAADNWLGIMLAVLYPAAFALQNAVVKQRVVDSEPLVVLLNTKLFAMLPLLVYALLRLGADATQLSWQGSAIIFCSTFVSTFLGLLLLYRAMKLTSFATANLMKAAEPVFVLAFSAMLFPITLTPTVLLGITMILASVLALAILKIRSKHN